jgi:hypothetical protein
MVQERPANTVSSDALPPAGLRSAYQRFLDRLPYQDSRSASNQ